MKVLVGKTFGIGNAIMAIPMLKAIYSLDCVDRLDVLVGSTPDDIGASTVFGKMIGTTIDNMFFDFVKEDIRYDVAIMSMPFDGRWKNGVHFNASDVMDGKTRPDPSTIGLSSWKEHEVMYQMKNAYNLGYPEAKRTPNTTFMLCSSYIYEKSLYLGVGYKKDEAGFWRIKHWGNDNFRTFIEMFLDEFKDWDICSTGDIFDWKMTLQDLSKISDRCHFDMTGIDGAIDCVRSCSLYVGNDTGMMHVADSFCIPCVVPFFLKNSMTKARPFNVRDSVCIDGFDRDVTPSEVMAHVRSLISLKKVVHDV